MSDHPTLPVTDEEEEAFRAMTPTETKDKP